MKRLLAVVVAVISLGLASCSGGGGDDGFSFQGSWMITERYVGLGSNYPYCYPGNDKAGVWTIQQDQTSITATSPSGLGYAGIANPDTGSISWQGSPSARYFISYTGQAESDDAFSGQVVETTELAPCRWIWSMTAERLR